MSYERAIADGDGRAYDFGVEVMCLVLLQVVKCFVSEIAVGA